MPETECLLIQGGIPLCGEISISGAKNTALPLLAASLLTESEMRFDNMPKLQDVATMLELLNHLGVECDWNTAAASVLIKAGKPHLHQPPCSLVQAMRASFLVLGPLLAATGRAKVPLPGGCAIGARPVDQHLKGLAALGADIKTVKDFVVAAAPPGGLKAAHITLDVATVTGTENILMAAALAKGTTIIDNAACEPEVVDLANCLIAMGARISGQGSGRLVIEGVNTLQGAAYTVPPDRIESGSYLIAAAATGGQIRIVDTNPAILTAVLSKLEQAGASIEQDADSVTLDMGGRRPTSVDIETAPYPGFPTDLQPQFMALNALASGVASMAENLFENRFMNVQALNQMGAKISAPEISALSAKGNYCTRVEGVPKLKEACVSATDLRASFSLVIAALATKGETRIDHLHHMDRGYERPEEKLTSLGANIRRVSTKQQVPLCQH